MSKYIKEDVETMLIHHKENESRNIGVVVNDHVKYEGRGLEDGFVMVSLNVCSRHMYSNGEL